MFKKEVLVSELLQAVEFGYCIIFLGAVMCLHLSGGVLDAIGAVEMADGCWKTAGTKQ